MSRDTQGKIIAFNKKLAAAGQLLPASDFEKSEKMVELLKDIGLQPQFMVAKGGWFYRPHARGYTNQPAEAA